MPKHFYELDLSDSVLDALDTMNFTECTPIQEETIPYLLKGRDLIGIAQTGTGKTAAYLLPILDRLTTEDFHKDVINCLIMSPTRELAQQIDQHLTGFSYFMPVSSATVYGGNDGARYEQERRSLALGADIVIATPGRLISHISLGNVDLSHVSIFILDEADRMLDMGFYNDIMQIAAQLPSERQTILFSATMPDKIEQLTHKLLHNPVKVALAISKPAEKIKQSAYICYEIQKLKIIQHLFSQEKPDRVLVFASTKQKVKEIAQSLKRMKLNVGEMHSDLDQSQRDDMMREFKNRTIDLLVATDILSRGIDIDDISLVINYDVPHDSEDYIHRIGRTARANNDGRAITFVSEKEQSSFRAIESFIGKVVDKEPVPAEFGEAPEYAPARGGGGGRGRKSYHNRQGRYSKPNKHNGPAGGGSASASASSSQDSGQNRQQQHRGGKSRRPKSGQSGKPQTGKTE